MQTPVICTGNLQPSSGVRYKLYQLQTLVSRDGSHTAQKLKFGIHPRMINQQLPTFPRWNMYICNPVFYQVKCVENLLW